MGPDGWIDLHLSNFHIAFLENIGRLLNELGKGDVLAFLCFLFAVAGYLVSKPRWLRSAGGGILTVCGFEFFHLHQNRFLSFLG